VNNSDRLELSLDEQTLALSPLDLKPPPLALSPPPLALNPSPLDLNPPLLDLNPPLLDLNPLFPLPVRPKHVLPAYKHTLPAEEPHADQQEESDGDTKEVRTTDRPSALSHCDNTSREPITFAGPPVEDGIIIIIIIIIMIIIIMIINMLMPAPVIVLNI
jgi:hypothetical protein